MTRMVKMSVMLVVLIGVFAHAGFTVEKTVVYLRAGMMPPLTEYILQGLEQEALRKTRSCSRKSWSLPLMIFRRW